MTNQVAPDTYRRMRRSLRFIRLRQQARWFCDLIGLGPGTLERLCCALLASTGLLASILILGFALEGSSVKWLIVAAVAGAVVFAAWSALIVLGNDEEMESRRQWIWRNLPIAKAVWEEHREQVREQKAERQEQIRIERSVTGSPFGQVAHSFAEAVGVIVLALSSGTKRPQNSCVECGYTWYPRGKDVSLACPSCGSRSVQLYAGAEAVGWGCMMLVAVVLLLVLFGSFVR